MGVDLYMGSTYTRFNTVHSQIKQRKVKIEQTWQKMVTLELKVKVTVLIFTRVACDSQLELLINLWPSVHTIYSPSSINAPFYGYSKLL